MLLQHNQHAFRRIIFWLSFKKWWISVELFGIDSESIPNLCKVNPRIQVEHTITEEVWDSFQVETILWSNCKSRPPNKFFWRHFLWPPSFKTIGWTPQKCIKTGWPGALSARIQPPVLEHFWRPPMWILWRHNLASQAGWVVGCWVPWVCCKIHVLLLVEAISCLNCEAWDLPTWIGLLSKLTDSYIISVEL